MRDRLNVQRNLSTRLDYALSCEYGRVTIALGSFSMSIIATGTYQNGQIKLDSLPPGIDRARVRVEFETSDVTIERKKFSLQFGMLATPGAPLSTWDDFLDTKKQWTPKE